MSPKVSVILPVYNGASFVQKALASIRSQTFTDWELIAIDDGSQDNSLAICQEFAAMEPRIHLYVNTINRGLAATMNRLTTLAKGEYIAVQEQDDISCPERLAQEVNLLISKPEVGLVSGIAEWNDDNGQVIGYFPGLLKRGEQYPQSLTDMVSFLYVEQCKVVNAGCMFRRSIIDRILNPFDVNAKMSIDWQFFLHLAHHWKIWGLNQVVVRMNRDANHQHITSQKELQFKEARRCIRKIYHMYRNNNISPINHTLFRRAMTTQLILEGRSYSRGNGILKLLQAIFYSPLNLYAWQSLFEILLRGAFRVARLQQ